MKRKLLNKATSIVLSAAMVLTLPNVAGLNPEVEASTINSDGLYVSDLPIEKVEGLSEDFFMGADISSAQALYDAGVKYYNEDGNEQDLYELMADAGINYVRLRLWNDPYKRGIEEADKNVVNSYGGGVCDINYVKKMALAAQKAGLQVLLDFHYSDFWADPGKQTKPKAWENYNASQTATAVYNYTLDSLNALKDAGVNNIGMVQVGNETTSQICGYGITTADGYNVFAKGCQAVREFDEDILIAVHFTNQQAFDYGNVASRMINNGVDFDILSSSYYPEYSTHGSIESICSNLAKAQAITNTFTGKKIDVLISEVGYYYQAKTSAQPAYNKYGVSKEAQAIFLRDLIAGVSEIGGLGVFYWEPAWVDVGLDYNKTGTGWATDNAAEYDKGAIEYGGGKCATTDLALFAANSNEAKRIDALEGLNVFKYVYKGTTSATEVKSKENIVVKLSAGDDIVLPDTATITLRSLREVEVNVDWNQDEINAINNNIEGDYYVTGSLEGFDEDIYATIEILDRSIVKVDVPQVVVPLGQSLDNYLPSTLKATLNGGEETNVNVTWSEEDTDRIDTSKEGNYYVSGTVEGYEQGVYINVVVAPAATSGNLVLNPSFESPSGSNLRVFDNWSTNASVGAGDTLPVYTENRTAYDGSRRLSIWTGSYDNYTAECYQEIDISEYGSGIYCASIYQMGNINNISLYVKDGAYDSDIVTSKVIGTSDGWTKTELYVNVTNESKLTIGILAENVGKSEWSNMDVASVTYCGEGQVATNKDKLEDLVNSILEEYISDYELTSKVSNAINNAESVLNNDESIDDDYVNAYNTLVEALSEINFAVKVKEGVNCTVSTDVSKAKPGDEVKVTVEPDDNYNLDSITVIASDLSKVEVDGDTFVMPYGSVTVSANVVKDEKAYLSSVLRTYYDGDGKLYVAFADGIEGAEPDMVINGKNAYELTNDLSYGDNWYKFRVKATYGSFEVYEVKGEDVTLQILVDEGTTNYNNFIGGTKTYLYESNLYATLDEVMTEVNKIVYTFYVYAPGYSEISLRFNNTTEAGGTMFTISGWTGARFYVMEDASDELGEGWLKYNLTSKDGGFQIYNSSNGREESNIVWIANIGIDGGTDVYEKVLGGYVYYLVTDGKIYNNLIDTGVYFYGTLDKPVVTIAESTKENSYVASWAPVENATEYEVQVGGNTVATLDGDTTSIELTATYSGSNRINVIAKALGYHDGKSSSVTVYVPDEVISAKVTSTGDTTATLEWTFTAGGDADGFIIYQKEGSGSYNKVATVGATIKSYNLTGLKKDGKYTFKVTPYVENTTATILGTSATATLGGNDASAEDSEVKNGPKAGTTIKDKKYTYKVTKAGTTATAGEVAVTGLKNKNLTTIKIAAKVTIDGVSYKVTSVAAKAFKGNKKIKKVIIGKSVKTIGANAFAGDKKLTSVTINSKVLKSIGSKAFNNCKKLKKVIIKSAKLKKIGKAAFKGIKKKATFKVPKAKKSKYKKMIKKAGAKNPKVK